MAVLIAAARSPFAGAGGALAGWHPVDLTAAVLTAALQRAAVDPGDVDGLWVGCAEPVGAQGANLARAAALAAGWPEHVGGQVVDRAETSGSAALHAAADALRSGRARVVAVAGVCSASTVAPGANALSRTYGKPWGDAPARRLHARGGLLSGPQAAELAAARAGLERQALDAWALRSRRRRFDRGATASVIGVAARPGTETAVRARTAVTADVLRPAPGDIAGLAGVFEDDGLLTAMSFAAAADGVTVLILGRDGDGIGELVHTALAAGDPRDPLGGLHTMDLGVMSIDAWEILEPTAVHPLLACPALGIDPTTQESSVNVCGGTLAVGDAGAAEELRLSVDRLPELRPGEHLAAIAAGTGGSAASVWRRHWMPHDTDPEPDPEPRTAPVAGCRAGCRGPNPGAGVA